MSTRDPYSGDAAVLVMVLRHSNNIEDAGARLGVSARQVSRLCQKHNIQDPKSLTRNEKIKKSLSADRLIKLLGQHTSVKAAYESLGMSEWTFFAHLERRGLDHRPTQYLKQYQRTETTETAADWGYKGPNPTKISSDGGGPIEQSDVTQAYKLGWAEAQFKKKFGDLRYTDINLGRRAS